MARTLNQLSPDEEEFLTDRHLGTLTTLRAGASPHVTAIAFTVDFGNEIARIITSDGSQKVRNIERSPRVAICQVDGRRWLTLEGLARVDRSPAGVTRAVEAFEQRYRPTRPNPERVAVEIVIDRVLGRA